MCGGAFVLRCQIYWGHAYRVVVVVLRFPLSFSNVSLFWFLLFVPLFVMFIVLVIIFSSCSLSGKHFAVHARRTQYLQ